MHANPVCDGDKRISFSSISAQVKLFALASMMICVSTLLLTPIIPAAVVAKKNFHTGCSFIMNVKEIVKMVQTIGGLADRHNLFFKVSTHPVSIVKTRQ